MKLIVMKFSGGMLHAARNSRRHFDGNHCHIACSLSRDFKRIPRVYLYSLKLKVCNGNNAACSIVTIVRG